MAHRPAKFGAEKNVHQNVVDFIDVQYPGTLYRTDFAAGMKMPPWIAVQHRRLQSGPGFPDLIIIHPRRIDDTDYNGLALEIKRAGTRMQKKNGDWASEHLTRQNRVLEQLVDLGWAAYFAVGFDEAKTVIDWYLGGGERFMHYGRLPITGIEKVTASINLDAEPF